MPILALAGVALNAPANRGDVAASPQRVIVLGFDGLDGRTTVRRISQRELPHLARLAATSGAGLLRPTSPPESPVSWSAMVTGLNPGRTGIFGFVRRDSERNTLENGLVEIHPGLFLAERLPLTPATLRNRRHGDAFWETSAARGVATIAITVPVSFPARRIPNLKVLSGLGVGDLMGTQGTFQYFTTRSTEVPPESETLLGGHVRTFTKGSAGALFAELDGPSLPHRSAAPRPSRSTVLLNLIPQPDGGAEIVAADRNSVPLTRLEVGTWSPLVPIKFRVAGIVPMRGLVRFLLVRLGGGPQDPDAALYVSPIQIDPAHPAMPISVPSGWSARLASRLGLFKTAGLPTELWARADGYLDETAYLADVWEVEATWERMVESQLSEPGWRLLVAVNQLSDHIGHLLPGDEQASREFARRIDAFVGRVLDRNVDANTVLLVVSDHGMAPFRRAFNVNRWLEEEGFLRSLEGGVKSPSLSRFYRGSFPIAGINWTETRAYAAGLGGIFINVRGRERSGIVDPEEKRSVEEAVRSRLLSFIDPETGQRVVTSAERSGTLYSGEFTADAPDIVLGLSPGYRVSWRTALAGSTEAVLEDNLSPWRSDHCSMDARSVMGVLLSNRLLDSREPAVTDIAPTVLAVLGIQAQGGMDGRSLFTGTAKLARAPRD